MDGTLSESESIKSNRVPPDQFYRMRNVLAISRDKHVVLFTILVPDYCIGRLIELPNNFRCNENSISYRIFINIAAIPCRSHWLQMYVTRCYLSIMEMEIFNRQVLCRFSIVPLSNLSTYVRTSRQLIICTASYHLEVINALSFHLSCLVYSTFSSLSKTRR